MASTLLFVGGKQDRRQACWDDEDMLGWRSEESKWRNEMS